MYDILKEIINKFEQNCVTFLFLCYVMLRGKDVYKMHDIAQELILNIINNERKRNKNKLIAEYFFKYNLIGYYMMF